MNINERAECRCLIMMSPSDLEFGAYLTHAIMSSQSVRRPNAFVASLQALLMSLGSRPSMLIVTSSHAVSLIAFVSGETRSWRVPS